MRQNEKDKIFAVFNFSNEQKEITFKETLFEGNYTDFSTSEKVILNQNKNLTIEPWGFKVFIK